VGETPTSIRNTDVQDQGNNWTVAFEWNNDPHQQGPWTLFETQFPRDFKEINPDTVFNELISLALAVFGGQDIIPDD
jgi:hypothetical protein